MYTNLVKYSNTYKTLPVFNQSIFYAKNKVDIAKCLVCYLIDEDFIDNTILDKNLKVDNTNKRIFG
jgi:hypothetical protein